MASLIVLHAADLHLGGPVAAPDPAIASLAANARNESLDRLLTLSRQENVRLVLLAGDVFHAAQPPLTAVLALQKALAAWRDMGAVVCIAPGNHDPWLPGGVWASWPQGEGLKIFDPQGNGLDLPELGLWVAGAAHQSAAVQEDLTPRLPAPLAGRVGLAVLHASLERSLAGTSHLPYAPTRLESLTSGPFAFWALGHVHIPHEPVPRRVVYAGCPQGAHFGEPGPRGAWLIRLQGAAVETEFVPLAPLVFADLAYDDLMPLATPAQLVERVRGDLPSAAPAWPCQVCLRLGLSGPSPLWRLWQRQDPAELAAALKKELGLAGLVLAAEGLCPPLDPAALAQRPDVLGRLLGLMQRAEQDEDFLAELEASLAAGLHPDSQRLSRAERLARLRGLLTPARWRVLQGLWQGEGGHAA
ncbi:MAG: metallophosphoesterase [Thermodesulfobacteriota bacterium]